MPIYEGVITDKLNVVIDIGTAYTKLGICGECAPRCIIKSEVRCMRSGQIRNIHSYNDKEDLYDLLIEFVHILYFKYALLSPKGRSVVLVESLLCPTLFREILAKVLFKHYEVSSVLTLPSHLVSLSPLGIDTALVIDVGYSEAVAIPVCHGFPVIDAWQALPIASRAIHDNIKKIISQDNMAVQNISEKTIEDIKVRCCFVTSQDRAEKWACVKPDLIACPDVAYPYKGSRTLKITGKLRETAYEVMYNEDNDHQCLSTMILDVILKVNMDLRTDLAENILLTGGSVMVPGFKSRLRDELYKQLKCDRYKSLKITKFMFHSPPAKDNYTAWLGGGIYGSTDLLITKALTREKYLKENRVPDWVNLQDNHSI